MIFLRLGTVFKQQLARAQRARYTHGNHQGFVGGELLQHHGLRFGREAQTAVLFRNDHAEEALFFQVVPKLLGQVGALLGDIPGVTHASGFGTLIG